jgi:hypothetical protein
MVQQNIFNLYKLLEKNYKTFIKYRTRRFKIVRSVVGVSALQSFESYVVNGVLIPTTQVTKLAKLLSSYDGYNNMIDMYAKDLSEGLINKFELEVMLESQGLEKLIHKIKIRCYDILCKVQDNNRGL